MARVALVLGAGGVIGGAFHAGVLAALAEGGWDARDADLVLGTSAGASTGALIRAEVPPIDLVARARGERPTPEGEKILAEVGPHPQPPSMEWTMGPAASREALMDAARRPFGRAPGSVAAAAMPEGTSSTEPVQQVYDTLFGERWPEKDMWLVSVRLDDGKRVVFGRDGDGTAPVAKAVAASIAIPAVYAPVTIDRDRYVDGGVHSVHNADLVADQGYDLVVVSAPMSCTSTGPALGADPLGRRLIRLQLLRELRQVRRRGTPVAVFAPNRADRLKLGLNPMDIERRADAASHMFDATRKRLASDTRLRNRLAPLGLH